VLKGNSKLASQIIGAAIDVHKVLGPDLLESTYQQCLAHELSLMGLGFQVEHPLPVKYKNVRLDGGCRIDFLMEDRIVLELKSVEALQGIHEAQLLTYLKLANKQQGFLINFNVKLLKEGIKSFVL